MTQQRCVWVHVHIAYPCFVVVLAVALASWEVCSVCSSATVYWLLCDVVRALLQVCAA
jgi:hypothetical protein